MTANTYLLALAALAVSFVGFSSLVITLRKSIGSELSHLDEFVMRTFIQLGFLVAAGGLLPPLLSLSTLAAMQIWRLASMALSVPALFFAITYPYRRQLVSHKRTPARIWNDVAVLCAASVLLMLNASGLFFAPGALAFAVSLTLILCLSGWAFMRALQLMLGEHLTHSDARDQ
jgi:hypothetical protein